jgi:predicted transcriptional regulator
MAKKTIPPVKRARAKPLFSLSLDPAERAALDKAAVKEDRSSAYVARRAIIEWLKERGFLK